MKKSIITLAMIFAAFYSFSQNAPLSYSEVVPVPGSTKTELFNGVKALIDDLYGGDNKVILSEDKETGEIIVKATIKYSSHVNRGSSLSSGLINYKITLAVKDGKYRYELSGFKHNGTSVPYKETMQGPISLGVITTDSLCPYTFTDGFEAYNDVWTDVKRCVNENVSLIVKSIKEGVPAQLKKKKEKW